MPLTKRNMTTGRKRLEPPTGTKIHGAGQSLEAFQKYLEVMQDYPPALYMTYVGLNKIKPTYFDKLSESLQSFSGQWLIPQIGLSLGYDGSPEKHYEHEVAAGEFDIQIEILCEGLQNLDRPVFLRIGYEFNGEWNGYKAETFRQAWIRIAKKIREKNLEEVATVWCYSLHAENKDYHSFYPGNQWVDWWSLDTFKPHEFSMSETNEFLQDAEKAGFPVMIGECTPRDVGVLEGEDSWEKWFYHYFQLLENNPHVKATCYIAWDWSEYPYWHDWGDARIWKNDYVLKKYQEKMSKQHWIHGGDKNRMRSILGLDNSALER